MTSGEPIEIALAMRGVAGFRVAIGIGPYGSRLVETVWGSPNDEKEIFLDGGVKRVITNRIASACASLRFGTKRLGNGGSASLYFGRVSIGRPGDFRRLRAQRR